MFGAMIDVRGKVILKTYHTAYEAVVSLYVAERVEGTFDCSVENPHESDVRLVVKRGTREMLRVQGEMSEQQYRSLSPAQQSLLGVVTIVMARGIERIESQYPEQLKSEGVAERFAPFVSVRGAEAAVSFQVGLSMSLISACH